MKNEITNTDSQTKTDSNLLVNSPFAKVAHFFLFSSLISICATVVVVIFFHHYKIKILVCLGIGLIIISMISFFFFASNAPIKLREKFKHKKIQEIRVLLAILFFIFLASMIYFDHKALKNKKKTEMKKFKNSNYQPSNAELDSIFRK